MKTAATTSRTPIRRTWGPNASTLVVATAIIALAAPAGAAAKTIPTKRPATPVVAKKHFPAKHVKRATKHAVAPRVLCICVQLPIDWAKVQAEADFEGRYDQKMLARGLDWGNQPTAVAAFNAGIAALRSGTKTIDQILAEVDAGW